MSSKPSKPDDRALIAQQKKEEIRLAEADDEIARRKALAKTRQAGRSLLVATSERGTASGGGAGTAETLGG